MKKRSQKSEARSQKKTVFDFPSGFWLLASIFPVVFLLGFTLPVSAEVTQEQVKEVAKELACLCGTCPRRPLDECACGWADQNRGRIAKALEAGQDKETIIAGYVADFGQEVFVTPPAKGFNITAWVMPFLVLVLGAFGVRFVLQAWSKERAGQIVVKGSEGQVDDVYKSRLERELRERDS